VVGLALIGFGAFLLLGAFGRQRRMAMWAGAGWPRHGHPWANDPRRGGPGRGRGGPWQGGQPPDATGGPIGPEKNPQDYV
ncbi:MAG TPA: hypothetical protein PLH39_09040, partial [Promineifilum sp.]|nr:hypothetical protein [Promineifilum sp.]